MKLVFAVLRDLSESTSMFQNIKMHNERQSLECKFYLPWFIIPESEKLRNVFNSLAKFAQCDEIASLVCCLLLSFAI